MRTPSSISLVCLLLCGLCLSGSASAHRAPHAGERVRMEVVDRDSDTSLQARSHRGDTWIAGMPGTPYAVRLTNTTGTRVLVVLSVDGINAISGETASPSQTGYVLAPWQTTEITGWRKSHEDVARFEFAALGDSYAARTGRPDNVGTIGIAVFDERRPTPPPVAVSRAPAPPVPSHAGEGRRAVAETSPSADMMSEVRAERQRVGTAHGAREWAPVASTAFERATRQPAQITTLRYDSPDALVARGILPTYRRWSHHRPDAFPGSFVPDP